jgi:membrane-bound lytic murein transglycosylase MltF
MAHPIPDNELQNYLERISKADLIAWLMERCQDDEKLRVALLDLATPQEKVEVLAGEIRDRIQQAWQLSRQRDSWKMALPLSRELDQVLTSIQALMEKGGHAQAERLLADFVYQQIHNDDYVIKDDMIPDFAKALGEDGLHALQGRLKQDVAVLPGSH